jgi:hypothetical protein
VAGYIHWTVCNHVEFHVAERYHGHIPERVINISGTTIMWDIPIITDQTLLANWPHRVLHDKKENTCLIISLLLRSFECLALPTLHMPLVLVYRFSLTPLCDLDNDQITGEERSLQLAQNCPHYPKIWITGSGWLKGYCICFLYFPSHLFVM